MENNGKSIIVVLAAFFSIVYAIYYIRNEEIELLEKPSNYTIGKIDDSYAVIGYFDYNYVYVYKNKSYTKTGSSSKKQEINKRFLVKFSKENPENSELILTLPICDTTLVAPQLGWKEIPKHLICKD
ncbi:hypothetical protein [uncultured Maribacter sp.]|uniref:hypothetical protein n=1 Tax=uncultured Maribacter sp. TaxID=431308 RepID=UPI002635E8FE|nr:hypothetical protein [uncultured Maribacter sp.]